MLRKDGFRQGLKRVLKQSKMQIPRGLKPARNDKNKGLVRRLKPRPSKAVAEVSFSAACKARYLMRPQRHD